MIDPTAWKPHVTVAAIARQQGKFLLIRERINGRIYLNQPAGHLDPNESLEQAVIRETLEESAYPFTPLGLLGIYRDLPSDNAEETVIRFAFTGEVGDKLDLPLDDGIIDSQWMSVDEIHATRAEHRSSLVLQCVEDALTFDPSPLVLFRQP